MLARRSGRRPARSGSRAHPVLSGRNAAAQTGSRGSFGSKQQRRRSDAVTDVERSRYQDQSEIEPSVLRLDSAFYDATGHAVRRIAPLGLDCAAQLAWLLRPLGLSAGCFRVHAWMLSSSSVPHPPESPRCRVSQLGMGRSRSNKASSKVAYDMVLLSIVPSILLPLPSLTVAGHSFM